MSHHSKSPYSIVGPRLIERGYVALPIMPGTKVPGHMHGGKWLRMNEWNSKYLINYPTQFEIDFWSRMPDAGVCVVAGKRSNDVIGFDIDTEDKEILQSIYSVIPETLVRKIGQKGETLFCRSSNIESISFTIEEPSGKKQRVLDIIGPGRQTVLPPTTHPETQLAYRWSGPVALEDTAPEDLPMAPDDCLDQLATALARFGYRPPARRAEPWSGPDDPHRALNDLAMTRLQDWVPALELYGCRATSTGYRAVASWRASHSGRPLEQRSPNLKIHSYGIRDFHDDRSYTPLDLVMASRGYSLDNSYIWLSELLESKSDVEINLIKPTIKVKINGHRIETKGDTKKPGTKKIDVNLTNFNEKNKVTDDIIQKEIDTYPPGNGLVNRIIDWITDTSRRPNRELALGAALTIVGTLIGRRIAGPTGSATHLYTVTLAPTGAGKQHALNCMTRLMEAAGAGHHIGPSQFISMSSVLSFLERSPLGLCPQDEFGAFLKRISSRKASTQEQGISMVLRSIWGSSFSQMPTPEWASKHARIISSPAMSIYGVSTKEEFFEGIGSADILSGFLNRFLMIDSNKKIKDTNPKIPKDVPKLLSEEMSHMYRCGGSSLSLSQLLNTKYDEEPITIGWESKEAKDEFDKLTSNIENISEDNHRIAPFYARAAEIAVRIATIVAVGRDDICARISIEDIKWASELSMKSSVDMSVESRNYIHENDRQRWFNTIYGVIKKRRSVSIREIQQHLRGALKSGDIKDIMASLIESGEVECRQEGRCVEYSVLRK